MSLRVKRNFDTFAVDSYDDAESSRFGCVPSSLDGRSSEAKRARYRSEEGDSEMGEPSGRSDSPDSHDMTSQIIAQASVAQPRAPIRIESPPRPSNFPPSSASFDVSGLINSFPLKRKRQHSGDNMQTPSKQVCYNNQIVVSRTSPPSGQQPTNFTREQVERIVRTALQLQETRLREEYDRLLSDRLREQFESFSAFNRDYISRQLQKPSELSYLS